MLHRCLSPFAGLLAGIVLTFATQLHAETPREAKADKEAVLSSFQQFLDGLGRRDAALMQAPLLSGGMATLIREGKPLQQPFDAFVARLVQVLSSEHGQVSETMRDPIVHIDNDLAVIWTPYFAMVDGKVHHCGTDVITLLKLDGRWLISGIADNYRKTCQER